MAHFTQHNWYWCRISECRDRRHDLFRGNDGTGVVGNVDVESGAHHLVRVVRRRVFDHRDLVSELCRIANGCFDARMRYQPDDDELMDAAPVCTENLIRIDWGRESPNVSAQ
jgi:hypothetical protein